MATIKVSKPCIYFFPFAKQNSEHIAASFMRGGPLIRLQRCFFEWANLPSAAISVAVVRLRLSGVIRRLSTPHNSWMENQRILKLLVWGKYEVAKSYVKWSPETAELERSSARNLRRSSEWIERIGLIFMYSNKAQSYNIVIDLKLIALPNFNTDIPRLVWHPKMSTRNPRREFERDWHPWDDAFPGLLVLFPSLNSKQGDKRGR